MHRLSWWGRRGPGCQERWGEGPLLLEVVPLHGADEDALLSHPQAGGGGRAEGRRGAAGQGRRELCVHACRRVHSTGEEESGEKTRRKAKRREGCHCEGGTAAPGARGRRLGRNLRAFFSVGRRAEEKEEERPRWWEGAGRREPERRKEHRKDAGRQGAAGSGRDAQIHPLSLQRSWSTRCGGPSSRHGDPGGTEQTVPASMQLTLEKEDDQQDKGQNTESAVEKARETEKAGIRA